MREKSPSQLDPTLAPPEGFPRPAAPEPGPPRRSSAELPKRVYIRLTEDTKRMLYYLIKACGWWAPAMACNELIRLGYQLRKAVEAGGQLFITYYDEQGRPVAHTSVSSALFVIDEDDIEYAGDRKDT